MRDTPFPTRLDDDDEEEERDDSKATPRPAATPKVIEETLFKKRVVLITGQINDRIARLASERLCREKEELQAYTSASQTELICLIQQSSRDS